MSAEGMCLGFIPEQVIADLRDIGNWRTRAAAIDALEAHLIAVRDSQQLRRHLPELVEFLISLVRDPNFKISMCAMALIAQLVGKVGELINPHVADLASGLVEKLGDNKTMVRQATTRVFAALMQRIGPQSLLAHLPGKTTHYSWRVREEIVNIYILAMLKFPSVPLDWTSAIAVMLGLMDDPKARVRATALEAVALIAARLNTPRLRNLLVAVDCPAAKQALVEERMQQPILPQLSLEGNNVEHAADVAGAASTSGTSQAPRLSGDTLNGRLPFAIPTPGSRKGSREDAAAAAEAGDPSTSLIERRSGFALDLPLDCGAAPAPLHRRPLRSSRRHSESFALHGRADEAALRSSPQPDACSPSARTAGEGAEGLDRAPGHLWGASPATSPQRAALTSSRRLVPTPPLGAPGHMRGTDSVLARINGLLGDAAGSARGAAAVPVQPWQQLAATEGRNLRGAARDGGGSSNEGELGGALGLALLGDATLYRRHHGIDSAPAASRRERHVEAVAAVSKVHSLSAPSSDSPMLLRQDSTRLDSPSKAERLYNLKKRAEDRRAQSAGAFGYGSGLCTPDSGAAAPQSASAVVNSFTLGMPLRSGRAGERALAPSVPRSDAGQEPVTLSSHVWAQDYWGGEEDGFSSPTILAAKASPPFPTPSPPRRGLPAIRTAASLDSAESRSSLASTPKSTPSSLTVTPTRATGLFASESGGSETAQEDLQPCGNPEVEVKQCLQELARANNAKRKELDWLKHHDAITTARRLVAHHADSINGQLKELLVAMLPSISALRSSTSKNALFFFKELFEACGKQLSPDLEDIAGPLLRKAGELSTAGRDNFLAVHADAAISQMVFSCAETRVCMALLANANQISPSIRLKVAAHVDELLTKSNGALFRKSDALAARVFTTAAAFLEEGSLETRTYGKRILWSVQRFLNASQLGAMKAACGSEMRQRKVTEALEGLGPPEAPQRVANSLARVASGGSSPFSADGNAGSGGGSEIHIESTSLMPPRWKPAKEGKARGQGSPLREMSAGALALPASAVQRSSFKSSSPLALARRTSSVKSSEGRSSEGRRSSGEVEGLTDGSCVIGRSMARKA